MYTDREQVKPSEIEDSTNIRSIPMVRNLANVWAKYPQYSENNTLMVSNHYNQIEDFQRNDIILPEYHPKMGKTDFLDDMHLSYLQ